MAHVSINPTNDLIWEVQDQVQRVERMVAALCVHHGIDPEQAAQLPADPGMLRQPVPGARPPGSTRAG